MNPDETSPNVFNIDIGTADILEAADYVETLLVEYARCNGDTQSAPFYVLAVARVAEYVHGNPRRASAVAHVAAEVACNALRGTVCAVQGITNEEAGDVALAGLRAAMDALRSRGD